MLDLYRIVGPLRRAGVVLSSTLALGACATFTPDGGMGPVTAEVTGSLGAEVRKITAPDDLSVARQDVRAILENRMSADAAVQVALLSNRGLQAEYNKLGISEAAYVAAGTPPNPTFSVARLASPGEFEIERRVAASLLSLVTLPARVSLARSEFEAARYSAIDATFKLAAETRRAFYRAVAAQQTVGFLEKARLSAEAAADLASKLGETGAATKLDQARAGAFYAEVSNQLADTRLRAVSEREALTRLLGLWGADINYKLPDQLPNVPAKLPAIERVESEAVRRRVDLIVARLELDAAAKALGLTKATRFVSVLELAGIASDTYESGGSDTNPVRGFELEVQIPIFDFGATNVRRSQETYMLAVNRLAEKATNARSEAREAYVRYRATYDISWHYRNRILPLRKIIDEQAVLQYNGMLIDVFDLLTTARESIASNIAAIEAKRNFFLAGVDFQTAVIGGLGSGAAGGGGVTEVANAAPSGGH
jgi:outer membrane protein TolC